MSDGTYVIEGDFGFKDNVTDTDKDKFLDYFLPESLIDLNLEEYDLRLTTNFHFEGYFNHAQFVMDALRKLFKENANIIEWVEVNSSFIYSDDWFTLEEALEFEEDE